MTHEEIVVLLAGILLLVNMMLVSTRGLFYTVMFKILPLFLGLGCFWAIRHVFL